MGKNEIEIIKLKWELKKINKIIIKLKLKGKFPIVWLLHTLPHTPHTHFSFHFESQLIFF